MQPDMSARLERDSFAFAIPVIVFVLLHIARPWLTGFYHDDWTIFVEPSHFSPDDFRNYYLTTFKDRPLLGLILFGISSLWAAGSAWAGHPAFMVVLASSFVAMTALTFYIFLQRVERVAGVRSAAPALGAAVWIAIPWGLGYTLWTVSSITTLTAQLLFLSSSILFLDYMAKGGAWRAWLGGAALFGSYLTYQSFYLAFVPLLALALSFKWQDGVVRRRAGYLLVLSSLVQLASVLMALSVTGKSTAINIKLMLANAGYFLPRAMAASFGYLWIFPLVLLCALLTCGFLLLKKFPMPDRRMFALALSATLLGVFIGTLPFSVAGYVIQGVGTFSRTTIGANIWICTGLALVVMAASKSAPDLPRIRAISRTLVMVLGAASLWQMTGWVRSWDRQNQILSEFPYDFVKTMPKGGVLVLDEPPYINGVEVFAAPWDLSSAVYSSPEMVGYFGKAVKPLMVPLFRDVIVSWDGKETLTLRPGMTVPATSVWVFTPRKRLLRQVTSEGPLVPEKITELEK